MELSSSRLGVPWTGLLVVSVAGFLHLVGPATVTLAYDASAPTPQGLLLCHLVHWSFKHLAWDCLTFLALAIVSESLLRVRFLCFLAVACTLIPPLACAMDPRISHYAGLSGLVLGQAALCCAAWARMALAAGGLRTALLPVVGLLVLLGKQVVEFGVTGETTLLPMSYEGFVTVPAAHLASVALGALIGALPIGRLPSVRAADRRAGRAQAQVHR